MCAGSREMSKQPAAAAGWGRWTRHRRRPVTPMAVQEGTGAWSSWEEEEGGGTGHPEQCSGVLRAAPPQKHGFWGAHSTATAEPLESPLWSPNAMTPGEGDSTTQVLVPRAAPKPASGPERGARAFCSLNNNNNNHNHHTLNINIFLYQ